MRIHTDGERFGVETDPHDAELASAVKETATGVLGLVDAVRGRPDGPCERCGDVARLREIAAKTDDGEVTRRAVCADCQARTVEDVIAKHTGAPTVDIDVEGGTDV